MARKTKVTATISGTAEQIMDVLDKAIEKTERPYNIMSAAIEDDLCTYSFEVTEGIGMGDTHGVKGRGIIKDSMKEAFSKFNVHMAFIDDVFRHSGVEVTDIESLHGHEHTFLYVVTGFKIKGSGDSEQIVLIGTKHINAGGRIKLETPKISIDQYSSYRWYNELKAAADKAREEVALYKEGNYLIMEEPDEKELRKQTKLQFEQPADGETPEATESETAGPIFPDDLDFESDLQKAAV